MQMLHIFVVIVTTVTFFCDVQAKDTSEPNIGPVQVAENVLDLINNINEPLTIEQPDNQEAMRSTVCPSGQVKVAGNCVPKNTEDCSVLYDYYCDYDYDKENI